MLFNDCTCVLCASVEGVDKRPVVAYKCVEHVTLWFIDPGPAIRLILCDVIDTVMEGLNA